MPPPELLLELLLIVAHCIVNDYGELRYGDYNSFLQVNRALHACLNCKLWEEAAEREVGTQRVLTHLIKTNNLAGLGADVEVRLPAFDITHLKNNEVEAEMDLEPIPVLIVADLDNVPLARLVRKRRRSRLL
jgi:hypothetical protein